MEYISRCFLQVDGKDEADFDEFTESEVELRVQVPLMHKTGTVDKTPRRTLTVGYVEPRTGPRNWANMRDSVLVVEYDGGRRDLFTGVSVLRMGDATTNGEGPKRRMITLSAENKVEE